MAEGISFYLKKIKPMVEATEVILKSATVPPGAAKAAEEAARLKEAEAILGRCGSGDYLVVLDVAGQTVSSTALADKFQKLQLNGTKTVNLVVGGPWGVAEKLVSKADLRLSFGPMTFPHDLARLMLLEQIYRVYSILNKIPYHK